MIAPIKIPKELLGKGIYWDTRLDIAFGCNRVSPGCDNCWNLRMAWRQVHNPKLRERWAGTVTKYIDPTIKDARERDRRGRIDWTGNINIIDERLSIPSKTKTPRVFAVNWCGDLFNRRIPFEFIERVHGVMSANKQHKFIVLTKRSARLVEFCKVTADKYDIPCVTWPENVLLGVSVESHEHMHRIDDLRSVQAAHRIVSFEPLLGPVCDRLLGALSPSFGDCAEGIHLVMVGGETGSGARPINRKWVESIFEVMRVHDSPDFAKNFMFKSWGSNGPEKGRTLFGAQWNGPFVGV